MSDRAICLLIVSNTLPSATSFALADQCQHTSRSGGGGSDSVCSSISNSSNISSSPSASPSSTSAERLSPTGHPEAVVVVDSESPKSDCSSSSGSSSSSVIITNCTLCRQHRTPPPAAIEQHSRVGSEETLKRADSRLTIPRECDNSRKSLEIINRRLDDLNDEVRRYREFLGHEKARRDPALYKTSNAEPLSSYNDSICRLIDSLTTQLTMEWTEKLRSIQNQTVAKFASGERG
uniref:Uncharacterized protein n=1 Tax=Globodera pallida TaxID=36090 RepID=A0A183BRZ0_GLOPA